MVKAARASGRRGGGALCLGGFTTPARAPTAFSAWYVSESEAGTSVLSGSGGGGPIKTAQGLARDAKEAAIDASAQEQELLAELQELEQKQQKSVRKQKAAATKADCTAGGQELCQKQHIHAFPTVRVYRRHNPHSHETYVGDRTHQALESFVENNVHDEDESEYITELHRLRARAKAHAIDGAAHSARLASALIAATVIALPPSRPSTPQQGTGGMGRRARRAGWWAAPLGSEQGILCWA